MYFDNVTILLNDEYLGRLKVSNLIGGQPDLFDILLNIQTK